MKLGIIQDWTEDGFRYASEKGLEALEFCVNGNRYSTEDFMAQVPTIQSFINKYGIIVGAMGRWGMKRIDENGKVIPCALQDDKNLIDSASALNCPVYNCGCNWTEGLSFLENCQIAIDYFKTLLEYAKGKNVKIAVYNCDWDNFVHSPDSWKVILGALPELGLKYDCSHCVSRGNDYLAELLEYGDRVYHFHIKGVLYVGGEHYDDPPAGLDQIQWGPVMAMLYSKGYNGTASIEPHSRNWHGTLGQWGVDYTIRFIRPYIMPDNFGSSDNSPYMP